MRARTHLAAGGGLLIALMAASALLPGCLLDDGGEPEGAASSADAGTGESAAPQAAASALATRLFSNQTLRSLTRIGQEQGLDWTVLAAASQIETGGGGPSAGVEGEEQIGAIAFTLSSQGAPTDYEGALTARGGRQFAQRVLRLAERLRGRTEVELPIAEPPFTVPVEGRLVAGYGKRFGALHDGLDIAASSRTPIVAVAPGLVISTGFDPAYGNRTCIRHRLRLADRRDLTTCYGNQSRYEAEPGDLVDAGETIGRVGCSGPCLRPHVHLQVLDGSAASAPAIDPAPFLAVNTRDIGAEFSLEGTR